MESLSNNWMGTEGPQKWDLSDRVQGVGLISRVNTRPLVCLNEGREKGGAGSIWLALFASTERLLTRFLLAF